MLQYIITEKAFIINLLPFEKLKFLLFPGGFSAVKKEKSCFDMGVGWLPGLTQS